MTRNLRARLGRLEKRQSGGQISIWDVFCGAADPSDLDEASQEMLREMRNPPGPSPNHPLVQMLRREWARLGIPDPGEYRGIDLVEEVLRLAGLPTTTLAVEAKDGTDEQHA